MSDEPNGCCFLLASYGQGLAKYGKSNLVSRTLGEGYYFWYYENDAVWWGRTAKRRKGYYEVYKATINCENVLDTVFNETHYTFWLKNIEKAIEKYIKREKIR